MRYLIKGGVWKNSEDEILKAAVMKYGLNQWSRISSLLVRKSAKQCKSRWYEWLDPSIKKTDWTREEDEKLLHLAKMFPTQWRTVAPMVGRTPTQCVERYDILLDQAQGKDKNDPNDPRKLKPGEIDPNPESKAPRPDPLHMDEDEKEMIAEARVRLANTKGKKAKRLAREKLIMEAKRLAQLQKKRELKAAGINLNKKRRTKGIDYANEIPFERQAPDYVFKTDISETPEPDLNFQKMSFNQVEGRLRDEQAQKHKDIDKKRIKKLMDNDMEQIASKLQKEKEKLFADRTKLSLPTPQLQDHDLELLGKMNQQQNVSEVTNQATKALVGSYTQRDVQQTPMRTPMMQNNVLREAQNLIALQQTETPLLGGDNQPLEEFTVRGLDPKQQIVPQTPNYLMPKGIGSSQAGQSVRGSVLGGASVHGGMTPSVAGQTPYRDTFRINQEWDDNSSQYSQNISEDKLQALRAKQSQQKILEELGNLSKPKHQYQIEIPEINEEEDEEQKRADAEDEERRKYQEQVHEINKKMRLRSLSIQRQLPRPTQLPDQLYDHIYSQEKIPDHRRQATEMLEQELLQLLSFDAQNFPFKGVKPINFEVSLEHFEEIELNKASRMLQKEITIIKDDLHHGEIDKQFIQSNWEDASNNIQYSKEEKKVCDLRVVSKKDEYNTLLESAKLKRDIFFRESKKLEQLEKKVAIITTGYKKLIQKHTTELVGLLEEKSNLNITNQVFYELKIQEDRSILPRLEEIRDFYARLNNKQLQLQEKYEDLLKEKQELLEEQGLFE